MTTPATDTLEALAAPAAASRTESARGSATRVVAVDVLRGLAVVGMVAVNNVGSYDHVLPQLEHADWHGLTLADLVFPAFLVAAGAALPIALEGRRLDLRLTARVLRRAAVLVAIGLLLNLQREPALVDVRIPGILQRIALASLVAAVVVVLLPRWAWAVTALALLVGHTLLLGGQLGPPGEVTVAGRLDVAIFGVEHLYVDLPFDPEGLLGTLSAAATVLLGAMAGAHLRDHRARWQGSIVVVVVGGLLLGAGARWAQALPLNKPLWTASYALVAAGWSLVSLGAFHLVVDVWRARWLGFPLAVVGENALVVYAGTAAVFHVLRTTVRDAWYADWFVPRFGEIGGSYAFAAALLAVFWVVALALRLLGIRVRA